MGSSSNFSATFLNGKAVELRYKPEDLPVATNKIMLSGERQG
jgi:hypothetical protein